MCACPVTPCLSRRATAQNQVIACIFALATHLRCGAMHRCNAPRANTEARMKRRRRRNGGSTRMGIKIPWQPPRRWRREDRKQNQSDRKNGIGGRKPRLRGRSDACPATYLRFLALFCYDCLLSLSLPVAQATIHCSHRHRQRQHSGATLCCLPAVYTCMLASVDRSRMRVPHVKNPSLPARRVN